MSSAKHSEPFFARRGHLDRYEHMSVRSLGKSELSASWVRRDEPGLGLTLPNTRSDTFLASIFLNEFSGGDIWRDDRHFRRATIPAGGVAIVDQRYSWVAEVADPFESVHVSVPLSALNDLSDELRIPTIDELVCPVQSPRVDPVMLHLVLALLPALVQPGEVSALFADYLFAAIGIHLAQAYGGAGCPPEIARGGLAPWQERRVKEMLLDDLRGDPALADLAQACGLSARHLARAFKATTGLPPHRWLLRRRVERAKELLEHGDESVSGIALACGFADQSHLTRVFQALAGSSPSAWRRQRRHWTTAGAVNGLDEKRRQ